MRITKSDKAAVIVSIGLLGGMATTSQIKQKCRQFGYTFNARNILRKLERENIIKKDKSFANEFMEYRWELLGKKRNANN